MLLGYGVTDIGCIRKNNEDFYLLAPQLGLFVVADGMGGAQAGEHASQLAVETVASVLHEASHCDANTLKQAFEQANQRVRAAAAGNAALEGMGTTLVAAMECGTDVHIVSVGDSRTYLFDGQDLHLITDDQTWVNEVGRRLGLSEEALRRHPMRHVLTMAIGTDASLRLNHYVVNLEPGVGLLLCSDGLHGVVDHAILRSIVNSEQSFESKAHYLVEAARKAGGPDNITVVLLTSAPRS